MSFAAPAATPPPAAVGVSEGRAKRKISKPERFVTPPPAKRVRPNPPAHGGAKPAVAAKKPGASKPSRSVGRSKPPAHPMAAVSEARPRPDASSRALSAIALAALSSPGAAALIGQSPVPESAVVEAMAAAAAAREITSPGSGALAGLAMLLEATEESPTLAQDLGVAANMLPKGYRGRQNPMGSPLRPINLNLPAAGAATDVRGGGRQVHLPGTNEPVAKSSWGDGKRRRTSGGKPKAKPKDPSKDPSKAASNDKAAIDPTVGEWLAAERQSARVAHAKEFDEAVHGVASAAPHSVLKHALSWLDLLVGDLKGRSAALRRSRRRLQKVRSEAVASSEAWRKERGARFTKVEKDLATKESGLLEDLESALAVEDKHLTLLLKQAMQAQGAARGSDAAMKAAGNKAVEGGKGSEKKKAKTGKGKGGKSAPGEHDDPKLMTDYFSNAAITSAAACLSTGLNVAVADGDGDGKAAAAAACPAAMVPTPHIAAA